MCLIPVLLLRISPFDIFLLYNSLCNNLLGKFARIIKKVSYRQRETGFGKQAKEVGMERFLYQRYSQTKDCSAFYIDNIPCFAGGASQAGKEDFEKIKKFFECKGYQSSVSFPYIVEGYSHAGDG